MTASDDEHWKHISSVLLLLKGLPDGHSKTTIHVILRKKQNNESFSSSFQPFATPSPISYRAKGRSDKDKNICNVYAHYMATSFCHICNFLIILLDIFVTLKQQRIQGTPEQSHRCRCSVDSLKFPCLTRTDCLQSFPSRTQPGSVVTNMVSNMLQNMKQNKTEQKPTLCKYFLSDCNRYWYTKFKYNISSISGILCLEYRSLSYQKNWLSDISIFTIFCYQP